jgi:hypothetical protein
MHKLKKLMMKDLEEYGEQSSWDWDADLRFAIMINDEKSITIIQEALKSYSTSQVRCQAVAETGITKKRLRVLNGLIRLGLVKASWVGTGEGGRNLYGVSRVRSYELSSSSPITTRGWL